MERAVGTEPHQASAALFCCPSLSTRNLCLDEEGHISLWNVEQRDRLTGHKTKQFASRGGSGVATRNEMSFSTHFFFVPPVKWFFFFFCKSAAPAASVSVQSYPWQVLTTVFLRCAAWRGWGKAVFFWQQVAHAVSSDGRISEAAFVPGWHMASKEKCSSRCCFRPGCWEHFEAVSSGQTVVSLLRKEILCYSDPFSSVIVHIPVFPEHVILANLRDVFSALLSVIIWPHALVCAVKVSKSWGFWFLTVLPCTESIQPSDQHRRQGSN